MNSRKGLLALVLVVIGWVLLAIAGFISNSAAQALLSVLVFLGLLVSLVLSIIGLVETSSRGKGSAIAALILSGLTGLGLMFFALTTIVMKGQEARKAAMAKAGTGKPVELEMERFRLKTVPSPWVKVEPKKLNPLACLAVTRTRPEMFCIVIAEVIPVESNLDLAVYVAAVKSNLLRADPTANIEPETPETINGAEGARMLATARVSNIDIFYRYWMHRAPGRVYQVILWGPQKDRARVMSESEALLSNIEILAPKE